MNDHGEPTHAADLLAAFPNQMLNTSLRLLFIEATLIQYCAGLDARIKPSVVLPVLPNIKDIPDRLSCGIVAIPQNAGIWPYTAAMQHARNCILPGSRQATI